MLKVTPAEASSVVARIGAATAVIPTRTPTTAKRVMNISASLMRDCIDRGKAYTPLADRNAKRPNRQHPFAEFSAANPVSLQRATEPT